MEHGAELDSGSLRPREVDVKTNQPSVAPSDIQEEVEQVRHEPCCRHATRAPLVVLHLRFYFISLAFRLCLARAGRARGQGARARRVAGSMTLDPDSAARLEAL